MKTSARELAGMAIGAAIGAAPAVLLWHFWGRFHPWEALAWGFAIILFAPLGGLLGAILGAYIARKK